jgi:hypothetical protein
LAILGLGMVTVTALKGEMSFGCRGPDVLKVRLACHDFILQQHNDNKGYKNTKESTKTPFFL